jgi:tRNA-splicing ligase RtcB
MNAHRLMQLGVPAGKPVSHALKFISCFVEAGGEAAQIEGEVAAIIANPAAYLSDRLREAFARSLYAPPFKQRERLAPWRQWGSGLEASAVQQMANACALPVAVAGALMPDAHVGYGLPIGGVLATDDVVIPYAVGVDIACRMKMTVFDRKGNTIDGQKDRLGEYHRKRDALRSWLDLQAASPARRDG